MSQVGSSLMVVFEVFIAPGANAAALTGLEAVRSTNAQILTLDEARKVGFAGLPESAPGTVVVLIAVAKGGERQIFQALDTSEVVSAFRMHDVV